MPNKENLIGKGFESRPEDINREGRRPGIKSRSTIAQKWLNTETKWNNPITGKDEKLSLEDQMTLAMIKEARDNGTPAAYNLLLNSAYGNTRQEIDMVGEIKITDHKISVEMVMPKDEE